MFLAFFLFAFYSCCVHDYSATYSGDCARPLKVFPNKWYQSTLGFRQGAHLDGANHFGNCSMVSFGGKDLIVIYLDLFFPNYFRITLLDLLEEMVRDS